MPELPSQNSTAIRSGRAIGGVGRHSPDSVIHTHDSNFSPFSSASASVDRSSFASDAQDRDSLSFDFSQHVAALDIANGYRIKKADKVEGDKVRPLDVDDEAPPLVSARNSFSLALKDCQERRLRSETLTKKESESLKPKPAPLIQNKSAASNVMMKKTTVSSRKTSNFPSPGTPIYTQAHEGVNKGWQSERVAWQTNANKRLSFNNGRNQLPSKWEDAERWIFSPVASEGTGRPSRLQKQKRPKSKSGPLGAPGVAYYAQYSPGISMYDESSLNSLIAAAGVLMPSAVSVRAGGSNRFLQSNGESSVRSSSVNGCSNLVCQTSGESSQDEKVDDDAKDAPANANVCDGVTRKDAATQMSPKGSSHSSSTRRSSYSASTPSTNPADVRDVQVDERVTVTRWSKKHKTRISVKGLEHVNDQKLRDVEPHSEAFEGLSKSQRDEAKIIAWENLQKEKAEAAIRKLEMKLEKKRSRTVDKIMTKLKSAESKAQEMRSSMVAHEESPVSKTSIKAMPMLFRRSWQTSSFSACFTCKTF
ncbi:hypothetical protein V2J09_019750 [Rumex salicifolius]